MWVVGVTLKHVGAYHLHGCGLDAVNGLALGDGEVETVLEQCKEPKFRIRMYQWYSIRPLPLGLQTGADSDSPLD